MGKTRTKRAACQEGRMSAGEANVGEGDVTEGGQEPRRIIKSQPKEHHSHQEWRDKGKQRWDWSWYNCPHLRERECHLSDQFLQYINIIIGPFLLSAWGVMVAWGEEERAGKNILPGPNPLH